MDARVPASPPSVVDDLTRAATRAATSALAKFVAVAMVLAALLTRTSDSALRNLPLALVVVWATRCLADRRVARVETARARKAATEGGGGERRVNGDGIADGGGIVDATRAAAAVAAAKAKAVERRARGDDGADARGRRPDPVMELKELLRRVERDENVASASDAADAATASTSSTGGVLRAWESLREHVVDEFVSRLWYRNLTRDVEFVAGARRLLDVAFARLAHRTRNADLASLLLRKLPEILTEQLEAFRAARAACGGVDAFARRTPTESDDALANELRKVGRLHPGVDGARKGDDGVWTGANGGGASADPAMVFLRRKSDLAARAMLSEEDGGNHLLFPLTRELLAVSVFRPVLGFASPSWVHRGLNALLAREKEAAREKTPTESVTSPGHRRAGSENILASSPKKSASVGDLSALATDVSEEEDDDGEAYELARMIGDDEPERQRAPRAISASTGDAATSGAGDDDRGAGDDRGGGGGGGGQTLRAEVSEVNIVGKGGSAYAVYTIRVRRVGEHGEDWAVARRFRNFEALHKRLTESRAARDVALPQLPKKRYLLHSLDGPFVEGRRRLLDAYLASILSNDILCVSEEVGEFLSANNVKYGKKKKNAVAAMAKSLTQSVEDVFKSGKEKDKDARGVSNAGIDDVANGASAKGHRRGVSVGALSLRGDDLGVYDGGGELSRSSNPVLERAQSAIDEKDEVAPAGGRRGREDAREDAGVIDAASGVLMDGPLFGLFEALFHLQSKGFVRRTIVTVARQTLDFFVGSAVEDWVSKTLKDIRTPRTAANVVSFVDKSMWPNGAWYNQTKPEDVPALMREIAAADEITRAEVREALLNLGDRGGPLLGVLGARNYTRAALDFLAAARSDLMTRQIGLHVVEAVLDELFPEGRDDDVEDAATRADSTIGEVEAAADDDDPAAGVEAAALELYATTALQYER